MSDHETEIARSRIIRGRLAPSPTGAQHLGNARTYLLAWLSIRSKRGQLILRIEDIDSPRIKSWALEQAIVDLQWLGLDWDEGPDISGPHAPYIQTQRLSLYEQALDRLISAEDVYRCFCSRTDIEQAASAPHVGLEGPIYPGTCRNKSAEENPHNEQGSFAWRMKVHDGSMHWQDELRGEQSANLASDLGDFVVAKKDQTPAYQLAVVVDDHAMGVTEVVRGDDLIPSTFKQLLLYHQFGWCSPAFYHVPLVVGTDGRRLAKRHGDTRLSMLREAGIPPQKIVGYLAFSAGLRDTPAPIHPRELIASFDWSQVRTSSWVFDTADPVRFFQEGNLF